MTSELVRAREHMDRGDVAQAVRLLDAVLRSQSKNSEALILRAHASAAQNDPEAATAWLRRAAKGSPQRFAVQLEVGRAYLDHVKRPSLAAAAFRRALDLESDSIDANYHLGKALFQLGDADGALAHFRRARELAETAENHEAVALCLQSIAVMIPGAPSADNAAILAVRAEWARKHPSMAVPVGDSQPFLDRDRSPDRPLVIGYVSSFFDHENWMKPVWGLLNNHNRDTFQVRMCSYGPVPGGDNPGSATNSAWRPHETDRIFDVAGLSNEALADVIADEKVDVVVDLNGYSDPQRMRLFLLRPAPIVVGWFNMYATTGLSCYDLLVGDRHVILPEEEAYYSEPIARISGSYLTFRVDYPVPDVAESPSVAAGHLTFGSLCSRYKITPQVLDAWSEILRRAPSVRLLLRNGGLEGESERQFVLAEFEQRGIERCRIDLMGRAPHFEFLETYSRIDIALDTFPYNGGTTTTEAIWQGVPVVAFDGSTWAGRTSATILREAGLSDWVADDLDGYIELAVKSANEPYVGSPLSDLRTSMRDRLLASSVCDTPRFAREMEALLRTAWRDWCNGDKG